MNISLTGNKIKIIRTDIAGPGLCTAVYEGTLFDDNTIRGNVFHGNSAGGLFLYKNCGEYPDRPAYFERRFPSENNLIEGNWVASVWDGIQTMSPNSSGNIIRARGPAASALLTSGAANAR